MEINIAKENTEGLSSTRVISPIPFSGDIEIRPLMRDLEALTSDRITFEVYKERYLARLRLSYMSYPVWWDRVLNSKSITILTSGGETTLVEIPHALMLKEVIENILSKKKA